ncbi:MAG TPA: pyruvate kinase [Bacteroidales bacterium]|nr:MAG: pyruvate kinase [Bacteroidetes bacterium GWF2_33_38]OFY76102.1 MAG: pyruvate kinase [Bacteroidetes bacterium RIFOXYA12_FULL_33_9]HBF88506.1 pyruvate kinase [Bacteroidales bacterium]
MEKKTKIVATISDANCDPNFIKQLYDNGMNVARLNTAHQSEEDTLRVINNIRSVSEDIGMIIDTKGPEIRTIVENEFEINDNEIVYITNEQITISDKNAQNLKTNYNNFINEIPIGSQILIDDGDIELIVEELTDLGLRCVAQNGGKIKNKKSINVPNVSFGLPSLSEKDKKYVEFAIQHDIDFIAHSFVRNKKDVKDIQDILDAKNSKIKIIAKIENYEGVNNIDEIIDCVYGVMIARGDLAIEIPYEKIPGIQKTIINKCIKKRRPVIVATQMLHSMIQNPRPTRAEVSDIANAIYSKVDAIMLSGETTFGKYPIEAIKTMNKIAIEVEKTRSDMHETPIHIFSTKTSAYLTKSAVEASLALDCTMILADTTTGRTVLNVAGFRGRKIVRAMCYTKRVVRELSLSFGIYPCYIELAKNQDFVDVSINKMLDNGTIGYDDRIVVLGGNFGKLNGASFIEISTVQNLLTSNNRE